MSHQQPRERRNSKGYPVASNWHVVAVEDGLFRCGNPACRREFSAWTYGNKTNPERRIRLAQATAARHADTCTQDPPTVSPGKGRSD